jgi:hypothetical protein
MEPLVFGLIALITVHKSILHKKQKQIVPEPPGFRPADLRTLRRVYNARDNSPSRPSDRKRSESVRAMITQPTSVILERRV